MSEKIPNLTEDEARVVRAVRDAVPWDHYGSLWDASMSAARAGCIVTAYPKSGWEITSLGREALEQYDRKRADQASPPGWAARIREALTAPTTIDPDVVAEKARRVSTRRDVSETPFGTFVCEIDFAVPDDAIVLGACTSSGDISSARTELAAKYGVEIGTVDTGRVAEVRERPRRDAPNAIEVRMHVGHPSPALLHALRGDDLMCLRGFCDAGGPRIVLPGIASQLDLARAMFVAANLDELKRRGEVDDRFATSDVHAARWRHTLDTAWNDPAFARQRAECEKAAELVWSARRCVR